MWGLHFLFSLVMHAAYSCVLWLEQKAIIFEGLSTPENLIDWSQVMRVRIHPCTIIESDEVLVGLLLSLELWEVSVVARGFVILFTVVFFVAVEIDFLSSDFLLLKNDSILRFCLGCTYKQLKFTPEPRMLLRILGLIFALHLCVVLVLWYIDFCARRSLDHKENVVAAIRILVLLHGTSLIAGFGLV